MRTDPIIVIGMHRSGTELVTRLLNRLGAFVGQHVDQHCEADFFRLLNIWLLEKHGARWDAPEVFDYVIADPRLRKQAADYLRLKLGSIGIWRYLGMRRWSSLCRWGWKDPRTTITLPIWLEVFSKARVLLVERHGVDAAQSLVTREQQNYLIRAAHHERMVSGRRRALYAIYNKRSGFAQSPRALSLAGAFSLWEWYTDRGRSLLSTVPDGLPMKYEDLLQSPAQEIQRLLDFCGIQTSTSAVADAITRIDATRAFAYRSQPQLLAFAEAAKERLAQRGY